MRFENKVALVTGGGSGIGREAAQRLVSEGASVVITGRDAEKLKRAAGIIDPNGENVRIAAGDIGETGVAQAAVDMAVDAFGGLDILVNNAGIFAPKPFLEQSVEEYDRFLNIILRGKFFAAQAAAKAMIHRGGGVIVQTGSMWALQAIGATPSAAYSAANAGVHQLTKNLALELAEHKIRINTVAPAVVETDVYGTFIPQEDVAGVLDGFNAFHPWGRNGQARDVVAAQLFLASDEADWITGTILPVDGGVMAGRN